MIMFWDKLEILFQIVISHLLGDYFLQIDFIAQSKGKNIYHLLVHCFLYLVPFYFFFGFDYRLLVILISHIIVDLLKAKYKKINYVMDQILHYLFGLIYLF